MKNPFQKQKKAKDDVKDAVPQNEVSASSPAVVEEEISKRAISVPKMTHPIAHVLRFMYISEKSSLLGSFNQYVFKVVPSANKSEIAKEVAVRYNVKVKSVKVMNMPGKSRNVGRHSGTKPGYRKAIVVLKEGSVIEQAKP